ncbi:hypothetical protein L202_00737 [Cryptococcus amylolentus CBS 6039]|uniref:Exocyst complex protein EXO70 n=1 Tax=Cryptococcus amylolentus CBS 6039 TaxID=1295533 RepID=A0A1E3I923_9TREE|nr:hypothetical protein L202_00737 [Cryptococcus amylolentus CBS 6039]ODN84885.1 hypothetical protein L202_00737 [Cryptococcus amylolentus CBS 6039]
MDEEADLALLDQHLLKTNQLGQRMTNILGQLDNRLYRLDKAIVPLGIQPLTRKEANIESLLNYLEGKALAPSAPASAPPRPPTSRQASASSAKGYSLEPPTVKLTAPALSPIASAAPSRSATPADDSALLMRGPDIMALGEYFTALNGVVEDLERMWKGLTEGRGGAREAGVKDLSQLVEVGFEGAVQLLLRLSKEGSGRALDVESLLNNGSPTPPNYFPPLNTVLPLTTRITSLLYPAAETPKTATVLNPSYEDAISKLAGIRGEWICRSMSSLVSKVEEADEGGIWEGHSGREKVESILRLWEVIIHVAEAETMLITTLFPNHPPPTLLAQTLARPIALAEQTLAPTLAMLKRNLAQHTFTALDLYASLLRLQPQWDHTMTECLSRLGTPSSPATKDLISTLHQPISTLRSLSLRSFPEALVDIRSARADGPSTSAIIDISYSTITYLENLIRYEDVVEGLLGKSVSERSWLMGLKDAPSNVRSADEEGGIVKFFVADVLGTLLRHLEAKSRGMRHPVGQAFLLNNSSHIRNMLIIQSNSDITGPGAEAMLNKAVRDARGQFIAEFQSLTALLTNPPNDKNQRFGVPKVPTSERHVLKEAAIAFFDRFQELESILMQDPLNRQDLEMRDSVAREAEAVVRRGYEAFVGRCQSKSAEKYLRGTPDEIGRRVQAIFR